MKTIQAAPALLKRVKRHVAGPVHECFAVASPGLERICQKELLAPPIGLAEACIVPGGVAFRGRLTDLYRANLWLRTASRVLMRLADFGAEHFGALERRLGTLPWEIFLPEQASLQVLVASHGSRLYHREAVAKRVTESIAARLPALGAGSGPAQRIYVRIAQDRCTLSLDSSGELLHRRGFKRHGGPAPLRETLAAAILLLAGYDGSEPLVDPLCGSGSFAIEAALLASRIPPGMKHDFAFSRWPAFSAVAWNHIKQQAAQQRAAAACAPAGIFASDKNTLACQRLSQCLGENQLDSAVKVVEADFLALKPPAVAEPGLVVINPPYGRRLGSQRQSAALLGQIAAHLQGSWRGWRFAVICPATWTHAWPLPSRAQALTHGGLAVRLHMGRVA